MRTFALLGIALSVLILLPGLLLPVLTVQGVLNSSGVADLSHKVLEQSLTDSAVQSFRPLINPDMLPLLEKSSGGLKGALVAAISTQVTAQMQPGTSIEVYDQTRSIVGSVRHLYSVRSYTAATLILLFSIVVPFTKSLIVSWAVLQRNPVRRRRALFLVETIAKWSMADVFAVAVMIAYLAAQASVSASGTSIVSFHATFGPGFYWFAGYCLLSLAVQQISARFLLRNAA